MRYFAASDQLLFYPDRLPIQVCLLSTDFGRQLQFARSFNKMLKSLLYGSSGKDAGQPAETKAPETQGQGLAKTSMTNSPVGKADWKSALEWIT